MASKRRPSTGNLMKDAFIEVIEDEMKQNEEHKIKDDIPLDGKSIDVSKEEETKYVNIGIKMKQKADKLFAESDKFVHSSNNTTTYKIGNESIDIPIIIKYENSNPRIWFAETLIPNEVKPVSASWVGIKRMEWDGSVLSSFNKLHINGSKDLIILNVITQPVLGGIVSARELVDLCYIDHEKDKVQINVKSVDYKPIKEKKGVVRAESVFSGVRFEAISVDEVYEKYKIPKMNAIKQWTRLKYLIQTDLKGWMFQSVVDSAMSSTLANTMNNFQSYWIKNLSKE